jgi:hypothetical protein
MYFIPPSYFDISFKYALNIVSADGTSTITVKENDRIYKVGKCVLENVSVDYSPNGWSSHPGGMPTQIKMQLQFMETEIVNRQRLASGDVR